MKIPREDLNVTHFTLYWLQQVMHLLGNGSITIDIKKECNPSVGSVRTSLHPETYRLHQTIICSREMLSYLMMFRG